MLLSDLMGGAPECVGSCCAWAAGRAAAADRAWPLAAECVERLLLLLPNSPTLPPVHAVPLHLAVTCSATLLLCHSKVAAGAGAAATQGDWGGDERAREESEEEGGQRCVPQ